MSDVNPIEAIRKQSPPQQEMQFNKLIQQYQYDNNKYLSSMIRSLKYYYIELEECNKNKKPIPNSEFKTNIFQFLEDLLYQITNIDSKKLKDDKLYTLYRWFNKQYSTFMKLSNMKNLTSPLANQQFTVEDPEKSIVIEHTEDKHLIHRSNINQFHKTKELLQKYSFKRIKSNKSDSLNKIDEIIQKETKEKPQLSLINYDKEIIIPTKSYSTFYATIKSLLTKDKKTDGSSFVDSASQIKSSYSFNKPKITFDQLALESNIIKSHNNEIADKRAKEEIRGAIEDYGFSKSILNKVRLYKQDLRSVIAYYNNNKNISAIPSQSQESQTNIQLESHSKESTIPVVKTDIDELMSPKDTTKKLKRHPIQSEKFKRLSLMYSKNNISLVERKDKVIYNKIKNINSEGIIILGKHNKEVVYEIKIKLESKISIENNYKNNQDNIYNGINRNSIISNDFFYKEMIEGGITQRRLLSESLCEIRRYDQSKNGYSYHYYPLSIFDMTQSSLMFNNRRQYTKSLNSSSNDLNVISPTTSIFNTNDINYLLGKNKLEKRKYNDLKKIKTHAKKKGLSINTIGLNKAFISPKSETYHQQFLPRFGSGLLTLPISLTLKK